MAPVGAAGTGSRRSMGAMSRGSRSRIVQAGAENGEIRRVRTAQEPMAPAAAIAPAAKTAGRTTSSSASRNRTTVSIMRE